MKSRVTSILASALAAATLSGVAHAAYPDKPIQLILPFPPGGAADVGGRLVAAQLEKVLGVTVIVNNRPGGGTIIGAQAAASAAPDGYTLFMSSNSTFTLNPAIRTDLPYDPAKDFEAIGAVGTIPIVLAVNAQQPYQDLASLVAAAKTAPDSLMYASFGTGTVAHFAGEMFKEAAGIGISHVPYRGSAPAMTDLIGNQVPMAFDTVVGVLPHMKSGKVRPLAVTTPRRAQAMPDVPTVAESGYPGFDLSSWVVMVTPAGLPADVATKLKEGLVTAMADPQLKERMAAAGFEPLPTPITDWKARVSEETARLKTIAQRANITPE